MKQRVLYKVQAIQERVNAALIEEQQWVCLESCKNRWRLFMRGARGCEYPWGTAFLEENAFEKKLDTILETCALVHGLLARCVDTIKMWSI